MVGNTGSGRKPGFKHTEATRKRMSASHTGSNHSESTRTKISRTKALYDRDGVCTKRYEALCAEYPEEGKFFEDNMSELLYALQDVRTEKELLDIRLFHETSTLRAETPYQYSSTSCFAVEDTMIELLDFKRSLVGRTLH
jgi:hypothetical protein